MKRQARRLWLGDWQRDATPEDTVVLTPVDEQDQPIPPAGQRRTVSPGVAVAAGIAALCLLGFALSSGNANKPAASTLSQVPPAQVQPPVPQGQVPQTPQSVPPQGFGGPDLSGAAAVRAAEAALAKFPGQVERVTAGPTGSGYIVHVFQPDGYEVHVYVGPDFRVQGSDSQNGPPSNSFGPARTQ